MGYPNTGSSLDFNGHNNTNTALSTNIIIQVGPNTVGAIQKLTIAEDREIEMINEVGTDGSIDSAPKASTKISGSCERIRFDRMRISEAFSRGFVHVHAQRIPFDIVVIDNWNGDGNNALTTTIKNVWIKKISYSYGTDNFIVTDSMEWVAETIYTTLGSGHLPAAQGGQNGIPLAIDSIEQSADIGGRRGALDAPGLISSFLPY